VRCQQPVNALSERRISGTGFVEEGLPLMLVAFQGSNEDRLLIHGKTSASQD
jgi:hypothetical protein